MRGGRRRKLRVLVVDPRGRTRNLTLSRATLWTAAVLVLALVAGNAVLVWRYSTEQLFASQAIERWRGKLDEHQVAVERLALHGEARFEAVGKQLAGMQARLLRMEALGGRLSEMAELTEGEFSFDVPVPVGGPVLAEPDAGSSFLDAVADLDQALSKRERELELLAAILTQQRVEAELSPIVRPVRSGWISSGFGRRADPITGRPAFHGGIDFAGREGDDVVAVAAGIVVRAGRFGDYGNLVEVNHGNGIVTRYAHQRDILVSVGDIVDKGEAVGRIGHTGRTTGPHVHFEVLRHGRIVNPSGYLGRKPA